MDVMEAFLGDDPLASLYVIVLRDGDTPVWVAPFVVSRVSLQGIVSVRRLSFIGIGLSDLPEYYCPQRI